MNTQGITDYSRLSDGELHALLARELESEDPTAALAILEELEQRKGQAADTGAPWERFQKHYLPLEDPWSLYGEDERPKARIFPFVRRLGTAVAAACITCTLAVQAGGMDILSTMVRWTGDRFFVSSPVLAPEGSLLPEAGSEDAASAAASSPAPGAGEAPDIAVVEPEVTSYASFAEAVAAVELEHLLPSAIPEGYAFSSAQVRELAGWTDLQVHYEDAEGHLLRFSYSFYGENTVFSSVVEKDEEEVEVLDLGGTTHYFLSNGPYESVTWMEDETTECRISGYVSREELKSIVVSMYE